MRTDSPVASLGAEGEQGLGLTRVACSGWTLHSKWSPYSKFDAAIASRFPLTHAQESERNLDANGAGLTGNREFRLIVASTIRSRVASQNERTATALRRSESPSAPQT